MKTATGREIVTDMMRLGTETARLNKAYATMDKVCAHMEALGLTRHRMELLGFLYSNPEYDTVSALSAQLYVSKGSLSLALSKLEADGFVQKSAAKHGDDGRKIYISLTEKGKAAVNEARDLLTESAAVTFDRMDAEKRMQIHTRIKELLELFNAGGWTE